MFVTVTLIGNYKAKKLDDDFVSIEVQLSEYDEPLNLSVQKINDVWTPVAFYFVNHHDMYDCPTCNRSHWYDESMRCEKNEKAALHLWKQLLTKNNFREWMQTV